MAEKDMYRREYKASQIGKVALIWVCEAVAANGSA
jgi:hypothetical protein